MATCMEAQPPAILRNDIDAFMHLLIIITDFGSRLNFKAILARDECIGDTPPLRLTYRLNQKWIAIETRISAPATSPPGFHGSLRRFQPESSDMNELLDSKHLSEMGGDLFIPVQDRFPVRGLDI